MLQKLVLVWLAAAATAFAQTQTGAASHDQRAGHRPGRDVPGPAARSGGHRPGRP